MHVRGRARRVAAGALLAVLAAGAVGATGCRPFVPAGTGASPRAGSGSPAATPSGSPSTGPGGAASASPEPSGSAAPGRPLAGVVVVVDPGHNGANGSHYTELNRPVNAGGLRKPCNTTGTETNAGYPEHAFTWDVARRLAVLLRHEGATVRLTRHGDHGVGPCVDKRGLLAKRVHADLLLSIHGDGAASSAHGFAVLAPARIPGYTTTTYKRSRAFGRDVVTAMTRHGFERSSYLGADGIDVRSDLGTLNRCPVPAVMIEAGNMRNPADANLMSHTAGRRRIARGLAAGVTAFAAH